MKLTAVEIWRADGAREEHEVGTHILLGWCRRMIGADCIDAVNLRDGRVMLLDDVGHLRGLKFNAGATELYHSVCRPGTTHEIVGDVAIYRDLDLDPQSPSDTPI